MKIKLRGKVVVILLSIILVLTALFTATYALFTNEEEAPTANNYKTGLLSITAKSKSEKISLASALPITDTDGITTEPYIFTVRNIGNLDYNFNLKLLSTGDSNSNTVISPSFIKLQVDDGEVTTLASSSGIIKENITLKAGDSIEVKLRVWLSIDTTNDQIGRSFTSQIVADGQAVYTEINNELSIASKKITNLYSPNKTAQNNNITYNLDDTDKLMKDVDGNIRYYGANPNNYIYFNCTVYPETDCETWRIIGVFDEKIKIMRSSPIEKRLAWDQDMNQTGISGYNNDWGNASLRDFLNNEYYNGDTSGGTTGIVTQYYGTEGTATNSINIASEGIKNNVTRGLIAESTYYLRGNTISGYPDQIYDYERKTGSVYSDSYLTSITDKIAIPYASDYGYAVDLSQCIDKKLFYYNDSTCTDNNWMKSILEADSNWLLNSYPDTDHSAWVVNSSGGVGFSNGISNSYFISPVLYLNSDVTINLDKGDGSSGSPYRIIIR